MANKQNKSANNNKKKKAQQRGRRPRQRGVRLTPLALAIADPCNADLRGINVAGATRGYLARFRNQYGAGAFHTQAAAIATFSGYLAWFPGYHCTTGGGAAAGTGMSLFGWWNGSAGVQPANSSVNPFGGSNSATTRSVADATNAFVSGTTCAGARTLAACLSMRYIGRLDATAGEFCVLNNVSTDVLVTNLASVDQLFALASSTYRITTHTVSVKYRPTKVDALFRTEGSATNGGGSEDKPVVSGNPSVQGEAPNAQRAIVIAFRGIQQTASVTQDVLQFGFDKVAEWIPQAGSGINLPSGGGPYQEDVDEATHLLDRTLGNWQVAQGGTSLEDKIVQVAHTGTSGPTVRSRVQMVAAPLGSIDLDPLGLHVQW